MLTGTRGYPITARWMRDGVPVPADCRAPVTSIVGYLTGRSLGHGSPPSGAGVPPRARPSVVRTWRAAERALAVTPGLVGIHEGFMHRATLLGHTVRSYALGRALCLWAARDGACCGGQTLTACAHRPWTTAVPLPPGLCQSHDLEPRRDAASVCFR